MLGRSISEISVGDKASFSKTVSESDIYLYAGISGDMNPMHIDETYAKNTFFKGRVAHGMLSAGLISAVIGNTMPGPGSIYISQQLNFLAPVRIGDTITAMVEVVEIKDDKNRVRLKTACINQTAKKVIDGEAWISPPKKPGG
jgi:3-hydroxybutyryl-CoA dehydratase